MSDVRVETVVAETGFLEGPVWRDGRLYVSSVRDRRILAITPDGTVEQRLELPAHPTGLAWDPAGDLLIVCISDRRLRRWNGTEVSVVADLDAMSPVTINDLAVDRIGRVYLSTLGRDPLVTPVEDMDVPSSMVSVEPDGAVVDRGGAVRFGNGAAITDDGATLLVAETYAARLSAFDIAPDGSLSGQRTWFQFEDREDAADQPGVWARRPAPDGIAIDSEDGVWVGDASGSGIVRIVEGRGIVERIATGERAVITATLGGDDLRTLYMCAAAPLNRGADHGGDRCAVLACRVEVPGRAGL